MGQGQDTQNSVKQIGKLFVTSGFMFENFKTKSFP